MTTTWLATFRCVERIAFSRYRQSEKLALSAAFAVIFIREPQKMRHNFAIERGKRIDSTPNLLDFAPGKCLNRSNAIRHLDCSPSFARDDNQSICDATQIRPPTVPNTLPNHFKQQPSA